MPRHLDDTLIGSIYGSRNIDKILIEKAGIYMEISYFDGKNVKGNPARTIGPKTVFHYTSPNNFMSIFKDNKLWFSDCQFMNDKSEYVYIKKVFLKAIKGANIEVNTEKNERFIDYLLPPYNNIRIERQKKGLIVKNCIKIKRYYLLCTSLKRDSHSLWCYYSKNNHYQGYNFGINTEKFINSMRGILPNEGCKITYGKVIYDEEEQVRQIKDEIIRLSNKYDIDSTGKGNTSDESWIDSFQDDLADFISDRCMFFKNPAFKHEDEFRFIIEAPYKKSDFADEMSKDFFNFHIGPSGLIVPHLEIPFAKEAISGVTISPMMEQETARQGVENFFICNNDIENIEVQFSKIDLRY